MNRVGKTRKSLNCPQIALFSIFFCTFLCRCTISTTADIFRLQLSKELGWNNRYKDLKNAISLKAAQPLLYFRLPTWAIGGWLEKNCFPSPYQFIPQSLFKVRPYCYERTDDWKKLTKVCEKTFHLKLQAYQCILVVKHSMNHQYTGSILHHEAYNEHHRETAPMSCVWKCFPAFFRGLVTQGHYIALENRRIKICEIIEMWWWWWRRENRKTIEMCWGYRWS